MTATVIRFEDGDLKEWRFTSADSPDVMLPIGFSGFYRDDTGKQWTPDELGQRIADWAGAVPTEKTEKRPPAISVTVGEQ
jgi:hypothetical protein